MTAYLFRLISLSLASFFVLHSLLAMAILALAPRAARGRQPEAAGRILLALRLAPCILSLLMVASLGVPSYLMFEPESSNEEVSAWCVAAAAMGFALLLIPAARTVRAGIASMRMGGYWRSAGRRTPIEGEPAPVWVVAENRPVLALCGVIHPQILISSGVMTTLPPESLAAAMCHEAAHRAAHDNLKKLALILAPGVLPFVHGFGSLERDWARSAEWAADDRAAAHGSESAIALAEALVRIARMTAPPRLHSLTTSLLPERDELAARVERLLSPRHERVRSANRTPAVCAFSIPIAILIAAGMLFRFDAFYAVHQLLERFIE